MQIKLTSWLSLIALFALFSTSIFGQAPASAAGSSTQLPGTIRIKRAMGSVVAEDTVTKAKQDLKDEMVISQGTIVRTGANSKVVLLFSNGASVSLEQDSELNIETFTQDPFAENTSFRPEDATDEPSVSTTSIKLTKGELIGTVRKLKKGGALESKFTVSTPVGAAGIRGTTFRITYRPDAVTGKYNFTLTTVVGNVELTVASGSVNAPPVAVTDNKEVKITNIEVNVVNNQVTATTPTGQTASVTAAPVPVVEAPVTTVQQVQAVAAQLAQAVANVVFTTPTPTPKQPEKPVEKPAEKPAEKPVEKTVEQSGTPGSTTTAPRVTNP